MKKNILIGIALGFIIIFIGVRFYYYTLQHPIKMQHPCPKITKIIPMLDVFDKMLMFTAGIEWYIVKEKKTEKEYLLFLRYDIKQRKEVLCVMDNEKRDKYIELTREEYFERFEDNGKVDCNRIFHRR